MTSDSRGEHERGFPDLAELEAAISLKEIAPNLTVADAMAALTVDRARFEAFEDVEDLAVTAYEQPGSDADELSGRMLPIRNVIAHELWSRELLVASEIVDHLLFNALKGAQDRSPIDDILSTLRDARVDAAGFVVFGVHSLGLTLEDLRDVIVRRGVEFIHGGWGVAMTAQTNDLERTIEFLDRVREAFGVDGSIPRDSVLHWRRSRPTAWLERNPLLVVRVAEAAGTYYGNEALILSRLQVATVLVSMLATMQPNADSTKRATLSTSVLNNRQTLDIHHYMVLSPGRAGGQELGGDCVPISRGRPDIVAMSELRIDVDPGFWSAHADEADRMQRAVANVYRAYLRHGIDRGRTDDSAREARRFYESLVYFQRSFSGQTWRDIISLSTAFEALLHEPSAGNTSKRIVNEIKRLIRTSSEASRHAEAFRRVYRARNEIVHDGVQVTRLDIDAARRAYVSAVVEKIGNAGEP